MPASTQTNQLALFDCSPEINCALYQILRPICTGAISEVQSMRYSQQMLCDIPSDSVSLKLPYRQRQQLECSLTGTFTSLQIYLHIISLQIGSNEETS